VRIAVVIIAAAVIVGAAAAFSAAGHAPALAQDTSLGVDADATGNTATSLGVIDECIQVARGDQFEVDIFVRDVTDLLAWSAYLEVDPAIVQIVDRDVDLFQATGEGSNVFDGSEQTPDTDGLYTLSAVDTADPLSPESGSGVLARVTLEALAPGVSPLALPHRDIDNDGSTNQGPFLRNADAEAIGDDNDDSYFDGDVEDARVSVDMACPPKPVEEDEGGSGSTTWVIAGVVAAALVLAAGGAAVFLMRRRRASAG
jgi:hypothetical protein